MTQRLLMWGLLITLGVVWFFLPKVTEKDARAYAEAIFLEKCTALNWNPTEFDPPDMIARGGDKTLIYVYQYRSKNLPDFEITIDKDGNSGVNLLEPINDKSNPPVKSNE